MTSNPIAKELLQGQISPQEALRKFEAPWLYPREVGVDAARVETTKSGFVSLDEYSLLKRNTYELISFAALPGVGKSQLAFQIAAYVAESAEVLYFSTEMTANIITARIAAARNEVPLKTLLAGELSKEKAKYTKVTDDLNNLKLAIVDDFTKSITEVVRISNLAAQRGQLGLIVLDQMPQLVEFHNGADAIGQITASLKTMARTHKCPVINICQLNRGLQGRSKMRDKNGTPLDDGKPMFSDLKGSSCIEQDSDIVLVLSAKHDVRPNITEVGIIKNKNGKTGWLELNWYSSFVQFSDRGAL